MFHPTPIRASSAGSNLTRLARGALSESRAPTRRGHPFEQDGFRPAPQLLTALAQLGVPFISTTVPARPLRGTSSGTPRINALMPTVLSTPRQHSVQSNAAMYAAMLPPVAAPVQTPRKHNHFLPTSSIPSTPQPPYSPEYIDYTLMSPPTNYYFPDFLQ
ncbi:hypothetical protein PENSPDRAFT_645803 [Peniophora sp. CONT]|nr:hypothetical protein PENSPDRAFT_645803 [Peniophora sp. CONT]